MAVVKMGQIKSTPAKALAYISRPDATADGIWVSTNADTIIDPSDFKAVARQFDQTTKRVGVTASREGSVLAHHVIQSFDPKDGIDAATAHKIGVQLAEQITGGSHEYMIATHLDKGHVHNHIIFNAVNRDTGRKFRVQRDTIGSIRELSDGLCRAHKLSVLPVPERATGRSMADIYRVLKGESGKEFIRTEIDKAASRVSSWAEFEAVLGRAGVEVSTRGGRGGTLSFREVSMARAVRDYRLGAAYTEASIMARVSREVVNHVGVDASMVMKETAETLTVVVPGTRRQLHLTVAKSQVVRHGRALRLYVPANGRHQLSDGRGFLAQTVSTRGLYRWFTEPDLVGATHYAKSQDMTGFGSGLSELRALEARVNAKARWMRDEHAGTGPRAALERARAFVAEQHFAYQTTLVATAELMATPGADASQIVGLQAQLRIMERHIDTAKADIHALTQLTKEETAMAVSERISTNMAASRGGEDQARRDAETQRATSGEVAAGDAEREEVRAGRADERAADAAMTADADDDTPPVSRPLTLGEKLEARARELRAEREQQRRTDGPGRGSGRGR